MAPFKMWLVPYGGANTCRREASERDATLRARVAEDSRAT